MPIDAVIFDMDGVIVASEDYWWESRVEWTGAHGKTWTPDDQRHCMGRNTVEWAEVMQERLLLSDVPIPTIMRDVTTLVLNRLDTHLPVLPGAVEAVREAATHYRVALASGSPTAVIQRVTALTGLDRVFEVMVFGDDMTRGKPHPDIYLKAAELLGVEPAHCLGVEDSSNGVRSLHAAGMYALAVPSPGFPLPDDIVQMADVNLVSLTEFSVELVEEMALVPPKAAS